MTIVKKLRPVSRAKQTDRQTNIPLNEHTCKNFYEILASNNKRTWILMYKITIIWVTRPQWVNWWLLATKLIWLSYHYWHCLVRYWKLASITLWCHFCENMSAELVLKFWRQSGAGGHIVDKTWLKILGWLVGSLVIDIKVWILNFHWNHPSLQALPWKFMEMLII